MIHAKTERNTRSLGLVLTCLLLSSILLPGAIMAQDVPPWTESSGNKSSGSFYMLGVGPHVGLSIDPDQFIVGGHVDFGGFHDDMFVSPLFEVGFGDDITTLNFEFDGFYVFETADFPADVMAGAGLSIANYSIDLPAGAEGDDSNTEVGLFLIGALGLEGPGNLEYRVEAKLGVGDVPDFKIILGVNL